MITLTTLLVAACAGSAAPVCQVGGPDPDPPALRARRVPGVILHGTVGAGSGFGQRSATEVDYYSNVDIGPNSYLFFGAGVTGVGEPLFLGKGGVNALGHAVGPVGAPAKIGTVEFYVVRSDGSTAGGGECDFTVTLEMFDHVVDWSPVGTTANPNTCMPSLNDAVNQVSLGRVQVDLVGELSPCNGCDPYCGYGQGYIVDLAAAGMAWNVIDGTCFFDIQCWNYNGGAPPVQRASILFPMYDGLEDTCIAPPGSYPAIGYSADNFYLDANNDGRYSRNERYFYGGPPSIANLMLRLGGNDACSLDLDGDGFVGGNDIDYALELMAAGCPY